VESLDSTVGIIALAAAAAGVVALLATTLLALRLRRLRAAQRLVLGEAGERDLVRHASDIERSVDRLEAGMESVSSALLGRMEAAEERLDGTVSRTAVIRYDAFNETSGRQSSTVALLDEHGNGVVISAILQRDQARVYAKPVVGGHSELELSPEERTAIERAQQPAPEPEPHP
jgi:hypothetical protein